MPRYRVRGSAVAVPKVIVIWGRFWSTNWLLPGGMIPKEGLKFDIFDENQFFHLQKWLVGVFINVA